jgi:predicted XRE-type DNA-binding protein
MAINLALKLAILQSGLSQRAIASLTGVDESRLSAIIHQWRTPSAAERAAIATAVRADAHILWPALADTSPPSPPGEQSASPAA